MALALGGGGAPGGGLAHAAPGWEQGGGDSASGDSAGDPTRRAQSAQQITEVEDLGRQARQHYDMGDFGRAVALYLQAYRSAPPGWGAGMLYNIAVIYDKRLDEPELALDFYRRYIRAPDAEPQVVERASGRIAVLKARIEVAQREPVAPSPLGGDSRPLSRPEGELAAPVEPTPTSSVGSTQRTWGWVVVGTGVAAAAAGGAFGLAARSSAQEFEQSRDLGEKTSLRDDGLQQAMLANILLGAGGVAVGAGVVLLLTAPSADDSGRVSLGPSPDGTGAGVWWSVIR